MREAGKHPFIAVVLGLLGPLASAQSQINDSDSTQGLTPVFNESGGERQVLRFNDLSAQQGMAPPSGHRGFAVNRSLLRGFNNESTLRNGYRDFGYLGEESGAANDGAEVFKGPASALYGNGKPGGDSNVLARQADGVRHRDMQLSVSRFGHSTIRADLADAFGAERQGAFRLGVLAEGGTDYRKFDGDTIYGLAPSIAWKLDSNTRLQIEADFVDVDDRNQPIRLPLAEILAFPGRLSLGEASDRLKVRGETWRASLDHAFTEHWRWRNAVFSQRTREHSHITQLDVYGWTGDGVIINGGRSARRVTEFRHWRSEADVLQSELYGQLEGWGFKHQVLLGLELGRYERASSAERAPLAPLNLLMPQYGATPGAFTAVGNQTSGYDTRVLYVQDRIQLNVRWQAMLGLRLQRVKGWSDNQMLQDSSRGESTSASPRVGLVFEARPGLSLYGSFTQSSVPQLGATTADAKLLPPEESRQFEVGLQWGRAESGLLGTLSLYELRKRNLATTDLSNPQFSLAAGEQQSRGIEFELRGQLAPGISLDASLELMRAKVLRDNDVPAGAWLPGVAPWFASTWLTVRLDSRWTAGWGMVAEGRRRATWPPNELRLSGYLTTDVSLAYRGDGWRAQFSLANALGRRAVQSGGYGLSFVTPRAATLSLYVSF